MPRLIGNTLIFDELVNFQGGIKNFILPETNVDSIPKLSTTLDVSNRELFICINTVGTTITNFLKGSNGRQIRLLGEGFTTIANNANIKTNTGANKLLAASKVYRFSLYNNVWYEDA
jgi:hypothetical protein